jgi:hypothetical protein
MAATPNTTFASELPYAARDGPTMSSLRFKRGKRVAYFRLLVKSIAPYRFSSKHACDPVVVGFETIVSGALSGPFTTAPSVKPD